MAGIQSHYEINVSLNGKHFFATAERSATTETQAIALYSDLKRRFPEREGFKVSMTYYECIGYTQRSDDDENSDT